MGIPLLALTADRQWVRGPLLLPVQHPPSLPGNLLALNVTYVLVTLDFSLTSPEMPPPACLLHYSSRFTIQQGTHREHSACFSLRSASLWSSTQAGTEASSRSPLSVTSKTVGGKSRCPAPEPTHACPLLTCHPGHHPRLPTPGNGLLTGPLPLCAPPVPPVNSSHIDPTPLSCLEASCFPTVHRTESNLLSLQAPCVLGPPRASYARSSRQKAVPGLRLLPLPPWPTTPQPHHQLFRTSLDHEATAAVPTPTLTPHVFPYCLHGSE